MIERIKYFLLKNGYSGQGLTTYLTETGNDRRYKAKLLAASTPNTSGIIKYRGIKYYYNCIKPWTYCPNGKIEVEVTP